MKLTALIAVAAVRPEGLEIFVPIVAVRVLSRMKNPKNMIGMK